MRNTKPYAVMALVVTVSVACAVGQNASSSLAGQGSAFPDLDTLVGAPANPLNLEIVLDDSHAVSALMTANGGTLTATGADGTEYSLEVPEGALDLPVQIRMIPAASVGGLPFGQGSTVAIQLEPEGLRFSDVAILSIETPAAIPLDQQVFFGYGGEGAEFQFVPAIMDSPDLKIPITHFSGYGVSKGFAADLEPVRQRLGGDAEARLLGILAAELGRERQRQMLPGSGGEPLDMQKLSEWAAKTYYREVLKPRLDAAGESCAAGRLAMQSLLGIERQLQLLFGNNQQDVLRALLGESALSAALDMMPRVGSVCLQEEYQLCRDEHIIHRILPVLLGIERQRQLLGEAVPKMDQVMAEGADLARKCLRFELVFESQASMNIEGGETTSEVASTIPITLTLGPTLFPVLSGEAPLVNTRLEIKSPGCDLTGIRGGGTFSVTGLQWDVSYDPPQEALGHVSNIRVNYDPGDTSESYKGICTAGEISGEVAVSMEGFWTGMYDMAHLNEMMATDAAFDPNSPAPDPTAAAALAGGQGLSVEGGGGSSGGAAVWQILGTELFAEREWEIPLQFGTEKGSMQLHHLPE
jgi:hypothetical protein